VQSQDYPGAKWAVGQRTAASVDADLDALFDAGAFVRTHVMRPTWHFVAAEDIRWLLATTAHRVHQANAYQYRSLGIDDRLAGQAADIFVRALEGGRALTREELGTALGAAGIEATGLRLGYLIGHAEVEAILVNGPRRGKRQTFALLAERVRPTRERTVEEGLGELATRYVRGHGPAQDADLAWWSGLTLGEARRALDLAGGALRREQIRNRTFWCDPDEPAPASTEPDASAVHLLPNYDELLIAFRDRSDAIDPDLPEPARVAEAVLAHIVVREGLVVGGWRRRDAGRALGIAIDLLVALTQAERTALASAIARLSTFLGRPVEVSELD
jgi:Winged helix DNA-binding domain